MTSLNKEQQRFKSQCQEKLERQRKLENQAVNEAGFSYFLHYMVLFKLKHFENLVKNFNLSINSTYSDTRNILVAGALGMAKLPLGTNTQVDSSAESCNEQSDMRKETGQISKKSLREIEARNQDIQQLENSIKDLHDSFKTMLTLTQDQVRPDIGRMIYARVYGIKHTACERFFSFKKT